MVAGSSMWLLVLAAVLAGCGEDHATVSVAPEDVVLRAEVVPYAELTEAERAEIGSSCCTYSKTGGWTGSDVAQFKPEQGFVVRAVVDPYALAQLSFLHSCGSVMQVKTCSAEELRRKVSEAVGHPNPYMLYGRYKNSWVFFNGTRQVPSTAKFEGHYTRMLRRLRGPPRDSMLIGPLPERPTRMRIQIRHDWDGQKQTLPSPEVALPRP